jgi:hypothetical protein
VAHRASTVDRIAALDPIADDHEIVVLSGFYDFPWDNRRALELALFRTYAVPSIGELLHATGEFENRTQKRYDDTDILISEFVRHGYASDRGRAAIRRMNRLHGRFVISNADMLYVLSTFMVEPYRWNRKFGWREFTDNERAAGFHFWREVGKRMGIRDIPETRAELDAFNIAYEHNNFRFDEGGRAVADATMDLFLGPAPKWLRPALMPVLFCLMDWHLRRGFGYPDPPRWLEALVHGGLRLRARIVRWLPKRRAPFFRNDLPYPSYPDGYEIESVGPGEAEVAHVPAAYRRRGEPTSGEVAAE